MDGLALRVDEGKVFVEGLRRRQPLEGRGRRRSRVGDEEGGLAGERDNEVLAHDGVRSGEGEG